MMKVPRDTVQLVFVANNDRGERVGKLI